MGYMKKFKGKIVNMIVVIIISIMVVITLMLFSACRSKDDKVTAEKLSTVIGKIDDGVKVSREKVEEFEKLEKEDFETLGLYEILEMISLNYQYSVQESESSDESTLAVDFVDGRRAMITRFNTLGKIESFYIQFQSSLYDQGYIFEDRLYYHDLCNSFINKENSSKAYLLKKYNYFIILVKKID